MRFFRQLVDDLRYTVFGDLTEEQGLSLLEMPETFDTDDEAKRLVIRGKSEDKPFKQVVDELGGIAPILPPPVDARDDN